MPDLVGASDPAYLITLLDSAATHTARDRSAYSSHFAVSAKVWRKSTSESVVNLFGEAAPASHRIRAEAKRLQYGEE